MARKMGPLGGMGNLMKMGQKMQKEMMKIQEELKERVVQGSAGGGSVVATVNGHKELIAIKIDEDAVDPDDVEILEDLVLAAVRQGMKKAQELSEKEMGKLTGGINIPGLF